MLFLLTHRPRIYIDQQQSRAIDYISRLSNVGLIARGLSIMNRLLVTNYDVVKILYLRVKQYVP